MSRPTLLVTDSAPEMMGGGTVILRSLIGDRLGGDLHWASPSRLTSEPDRGLHALKKGSLGQRGMRSLFRDTVQYSGPLADEVIDLAVKLDASCFWIVLHGAAVNIAAKIARCSTLPMHVTVHDDPAYSTALRSRRCFLTMPLILRDFGTAIRGAKSADVIGEEMRARYLRIYGVRSDVVHRALTEQVEPSTPAASLGFTVGILGNTYGYRQLPVLAEALILAQKRLDQPVKLIICGYGYGERLKAAYSGRLDVEATGHLSEAAGIVRLRECTALYLNYPFGLRDRVLRETSFPTKLSTYIYAARPIIVHAPMGTSVAKLSNIDGFIAPWRSMNVQEGARLLMELASRPRVSCHLAAETVRKQYYDAKTNRTTMNGLLAALSRMAHA